MIKYINTKNKYMSSIIETAVIYNGRRFYFLRQSYQPLFQKKHALKGVNFQFYL